MDITQPAVNYGAGHPACANVSWLDNVVDLANKKDVGNLINLGFFDISYSRCMGMMCLGNMKDLKIKKQQLEGFKVNILSDGTVKWCYDKNRVCITVWSH